MTVPVALLTALREGIDDAADEALLGNFAACEVALWAALARVHKIREIEKPIDHKLKEEG